MDGSRSFIPWIAVVAVLNACENRGGVRDSDKSPVGRGGAEAVAGSDNASTPPRAGAGGGGGVIDSEDELIPLFVAQGQLGRTAVSCDHGRTWRGEHRSLDAYGGTAIEDMSCEGFNCDHQAHPARGIVFGDGVFVATFGWGETGLVQKSQNGQDWNVVLENTIFGGLAFVQSTWVAGAGDARRSTDGGSTWSEPISTGQGVRRMGQTSGFGGRIILVGEAGEAIISSDAGLSWWHPTIFPSECGRAIQTEGGIASDGTNWIVLGGDGVVCRSIDGGVNWERGDVGQAIASHVVWNGSMFQAWTTGLLHESADGLHWTSRPTTPTNIQIGAVESDGAGALVAVRGGWGSWDSNQAFYYSDDGVIWTLASRFAADDPIRTIAFGFGKKPGDCF